METVDTLIDQCLSLNLIPNKTAGRKLKKAGLLELIQKHQTEITKVDEPTDEQLLEEAKADPESKETIPLSALPDLAALIMASGVISAAPEPIVVAPPAPEVPPSLSLHEYHQQRLAAEKHRMERTQKRNLKAALKAKRQAARKARKLSRKNR